MKTAYDLAVLIGKQPDWFVEQAQKAATLCHTGQQRKYTFEPYVEHCASVARIVANMGGDPEMVQACWLHDSVEDTHVTQEDILEMFGPDVAGLVFDLTKVYTTEAFPDDNRAVRHMWECQRIQHISDRACVCKYADIQHNTKAILANDPKFAIVYLREIADVCEAIYPGMKRWGAVPKH